jgi:hypothetical protein
VVAGVALRVEKRGRRGRRGRRGEENVPNELKHSPQKPFPHFLGSTQVLHYHLNVPPHLEYSKREFFSQGFPSLICTQEVNKKLKISLSFMTF